MQARSRASVLLVAPVCARVLSPSIRAEALVSDGCQIAFQANTVYEPWFVDDRPRDAFISQVEDLKTFALRDGRL